MPRNLIITLAQWGNLTATIEDDPYAAASPRALVLGNFAIVLGNRALILG